MSLLDKSLRLGLAAPGSLTRERVIMPDAATKPDLLLVGHYPDWDLDAFGQAYVVHRHLATPDQRVDLALVGPRIRAIATRGDIGAKADLIAACPNLEIVSVYGVGYDGVNTAACRERGIRVTTTPGVLTEDVAELALGLLLVLSRRMSEAERYARDGRWVSDGHFPLTRRVTGMRAGILGLGQIGRSLARRLEAFGMIIAYSSRAPKTDVSWEFCPTPEELATRSDALFVTLSANADTRSIVGRSVLDALGPGGLLVNVSRGSNIDEEALIAALAERRIGGAALDVFPNEPHIDPRFFSLPNVVLQPHMGSATVEARKSMGRVMRENLAAHFEGRPLPNPVL
ncbi:MAG: 2-hydroxyacid dehydrogenase [Paracoccaceae bacterium]